MPDITFEREGSGEGGTVYLKLGFRTARAIHDALERWMGVRDGPLLPEDEEMPLLALYDALDQVVDWPGGHRWWGPPAKPEDVGGSRAPEGAP